MAKTITGNYFALLRTRFIILGKTFHRFKFQEIYLAGKLEFCIDFFSVHDKDGFSRGLEKPEKNWRGAEHFFGA
jgi:hypothetical protein